MTANKIYRSVVLLGSLVLLLFMTSCGQEANGFVADEPTSTPVSRMGQWEYIQIIGDANFTRRVADALDLLRTGAPDMYEWVTYYVGILRQFSFSGMWYWLDPPEFRISTASYMASTYWLTSIIIHDAKHSQQAYRWDVNPFRDRTSQVWADAEYEANRYMIYFFQEVNAPRHYILHIQRLNEGIASGDGWWWLDDVTW